MKRFEYSKGQCQRLKGENVRFKRESQRFLCKKDGCKGQGQSYGGKWG